MKKNHKIISCAILSFVAIVVIYILPTTVYAGRCRGQTCPCPSDITCAIEPCIPDCFGHNLQSNPTYWDEDRKESHDDQATTSVEYLNENEGTTEATRTKRIWTHTPYTLYKDTYYQDQFTCTNNTCGTYHPAEWTSPVVSNTRVDSTGTDHTYVDVTEYCYRGAANVYYQNSSGGWDLAYVDYGGWSSWSEDASATSTTYSFSTEHTGTHYSTDTFGESISTVTISSSTTREFNVYVYRKQYWVELYPNPHSDASTSVVNQNPSGWTWNSKGCYTRKCYVEEVFMLPTPFDVYRMIGYMTNDNWYYISDNGVIPPGYTSILQSTGNNNPNDLDVRSMKTFWFSEPGHIWLMPNSNQGTTDSNYAGYVENDNKNADTYQHGGESLP